MICPKNVHDLIGNLRYGRITEEFIHSSSPSFVILNGVYKLLPTFHWVSISNLRYSYQSFNQVSANCKGLIPRDKGHPCQIGWTCSGIFNICSSVPQLQDKHLIKLPNFLIASVTLMVSHSTSYCISNVVTYQLNSSLAWQTMTVSSTVIL